MFKTIVVGLISVLLAITSQPSTHAQVTVSVVPSQLTAPDTVQLDATYFPPARVYSVETLRAGKNAGKAQTKVTAAPATTQPPVVVGKQHRIVERSFALKMWPVDPNVDPKIHKQVPEGDFKIRGIRPRSESPK